MLYKSWLMLYKSWCMLYKTRLMLYKIWLMLYRFIGFLGSKNEVERIARYYAGQ